MKFPRVRWLLEVVANSLEKLAWGRKKRRRFNEQWASQVALVVKNPPGDAGYIKDTGLILGLGRYPRGGHGKTLQYSYLENPKRILAGYSPGGHKESDTTVAPYTCTVTNSHGSWRSARSRFKWDLGGESTAAFLKVILFLVFITYYLVMPF